MNSHQPSAVDLDNCATEPIHIPGRIQSFGALVAVNSDWLIAHCSENFAALVGLSAQPHHGDPLRDHLSANALAAMRRKLQSLTASGGVERSFGQPLVEGGPLFDIALHVSGRTIVIEVEPHGDDRFDANIGMLRPMMARLEQARDPSRLCDIAARQLKMLLGFDRVMVYRFHPDDSGEVFAEAREMRLESFFGLHYPASDIPPQARKLYLTNILRIISDVADPTVPILPDTSPFGVPLDLSQSTLRGVSPIHIEYLRNMGVTASMSISIIVRGKLWGLFACHHYSGPRVLTYALRSAAELFAQLFALQLGQVESDIVREQAQRAQLMHDRIMAQLAESSGLVEQFDAMIALFGDVIPHDGASAWIDGQYLSRGSAPTAEQFKAIVPLFNSGAASSVFATQQLARQVPAEGLVEVAAGALAIPVSRRPRDYIVLWRREQRQTVKWAGNPEKTIEYGPNGSRLTPRKSFEAWQQVVEGTSLPWTEEEVRAAEALRLTLLEVILRITDSAMAERARAQEQQELLIAELNHRVRNILNLIRGLISQSRHDAVDIATFAETIGGRIHALALAHDAITRQNWSPGSLAELLETEAKAYLSDKADRLVVEGGDALIAPEALPVIALVIHELLTNSVKYGSLCDSRGQVRVVLGTTPAGDLSLAWRETGGPAVQAPKRRGFGSLIVERSIPHELKGSAAVRFELGGLEADFVLPARYITRAPNRGEPSPGVVPAADERRGTAPRRVLLVEDNMIIAIDTEENLIALGVAEVVLASSNDAALAFIDGGSPDFALLDFNLGGETSEPTARALDGRGVPFAFATGYGEVEGLTAPYAHTVGVLQKPYSKEDLARIIAQPVPA